MTYVLALIVALLPTVAMAKGECKGDIQKLCNEVIGDNKKVRACLKEHAAELSDTCKAKQEANAKEKMEKGKSAHSQGSSPEK